MPDGMLRRVWAHGEDHFCISAAGQVFEIQDKCGTPGNPIGIGEIMQRIENGTWNFQMIRETIRVGLIGAGTGPEVALQAVQKFVDPPNKIAPHVMLAYDILAHAFVGVPGDTVGKTPADRKPGKVKRSSTGAEDLSGPPSTGQRPASGLNRRGRRTK